MNALLVQNLPKGKEWLYEVKFDGYRCLAGRDSAGVTLWSRRGNLFIKQFPQIAQACERSRPIHSSMAKSWPWMKAGEFQTVSPPSATKQMSKRRQLFD
jgi:ATP dependent DNA ligase domain